VSYVSPAHENQGIGRKLILFVENRAKELGLDQLVTLSTQAFSYFQSKGGFSEGTPDDLPPFRRKMRPERKKIQGPREKIQMKVPARLRGGEPVIPRAKLPRDFLCTVQRLGVRLTRDLLLVSVGGQKLYWFRRKARAHSPEYRLVKCCIASTSRFGVGQQAGSNRTPLGLHRVAQKIGDGWPVGTVFRSRRAIGYTWQCQPEAKITSRILWLEGLERGLNQGNGCDSLARYIYIHGTGNELLLGRPDSCGCVHLAAKDLLPLFEKISTGTLVWVARER
jgi:hypothetical protein